MLTNDENQNSQHWFQVARTLGATRLVGFPTDHPLAEMQRTTVSLWLWIHIMNKKEIRVITMMRSLYPHMPWMMSTKNQSLPISGQSATSKRISGQKASRRLNPTVGNSQIKKNQRQTKIDEEKLLSDLHRCNRYLHSGRFSPKLACQTFFPFSREYFIASSSPLLSWSVLLDSFICSTNAMWKMT